MSPSIETLQQICRNIYEEDPDHMEGGCGDFSTALQLWLKENNPAYPVTIIGGTAFLSGTGQHTHVWLEIDGIKFDPVAASTGWKYTNYRPAKPARQQQIIDLHTDQDLETYWDESYERQLITTANPTNQQNP